MKCNMWQYIVFFGGLILLMAFMFIAKLHKPKGTRLKTHMIYGVAVALFFTLFFFWLTGGKTQIIWKGLILASIVSLPLCVYLKKWIDKSIKGTTFFYKRDYGTRDILWGFLHGILAGILFGLLFEAKWPLFGLFLSALVSQTFILFYVIKLERNLGKAILFAEQQ